MANPYQLTKSELLKELTRCGRDPIYFINTYIKTSHPLKGLIPLKLYPFQEKVIKDFMNNRFNVVLKSRQLGLTTIIAAYSAWLMLFHREKNVLVLATKIDTASNLVKKVKSMIKNLPDHIIISQIEVDNAASFELENGSRIKPSASTMDAGRSEAVSLLIVDEAAHVPNLDEIWTALKPTVATGGSCILSSSPAGVGNFFHKTYIDAENGINNFFPNCLPWNVHPERDQKWFEDETKNMSPRQIAQEYLCSFTMSGDTVFAPKDIERIKGMVTEAEHKTGFDRNLWIWKEYKEGTKCFLTADVSRGDGADYSVFHIFDTESMEILAEYQGKLPPDLFANLILQTGKEYGNCMVVVENNTIGYTVLNKLVELNYPNIYYEQKNNHEFIDAYEAEYRGAAPGFVVSSRSRPMIIAKMEEYIRNKVLKIHSKRLFSELNTFVWYNGKPQALKGYHDDLIMACAIGCWVRDIVLTVNQRDLEYKKAFLNCITQKVTTLDNYTKPTTSTEIKKKEFMQTMYDFPWIFTK